MFPLPGLVVPRKVLERCIKPGIAFDGWVVETIPRVITSKHCDLRRVRKVSADVHLHLSVILLDQVPRLNRPFFGHATSPGYRTYYWVHCTRVTRSRATILGVISPPREVIHEGRSPAAQLTLSAWRWPGPERQCCTSALSRELVARVLLEPSAIEAAGLSLMQRLSRRDTAQ